MILAFLAAAAASPDCDKLFRFAQDQCRLNESMALDRPPDWDKRPIQTDMNICSFRDYMRLDIELNRTWDSLNKRRKASDIYHALIASQRAWITYRDKQCDIWSKYYEGGTIESPAVNTCLSDITKLRIKELGQHLKDY